MRGRLAGAAATVVLVLALASPASAAPTCEGYKGVANHGEHVINDYVLGSVAGGPELEAWPPAGGLGDTVGGSGGAAVPGGPGPGFHFVMGAPPGASFCVPQAHSGGR
jgi:hypothetical protein